MPEHDSFHDLMIELRSGDDRAAAEIVQRFSEQLIAKARKKLDPAVRQKVDAEDIVQSALRSFFRGNADGQFLLENWNSLWGLLLTITIRKCGRTAKHYRADCRDVGRECRATADSEFPLDVSAIDRQPTAQDVALLTELVDELHGEMELESHRNILILSLQGYRTREISDMVQRTERTVSRVLDGVKQRLERRIECDATGMVGG